MSASTPRVHAVGVIFENEHGQILVLKRHPRDPEGAKWGLPGGKVELGEDSAATAVREVQEEIGYHVDPSKLQRLKTYHWDRDDIDLTFEVFKLPISGEGVKLEIDQNEHTEHWWVTPRELYNRQDLMAGLYPILKDKYSLADN